MPKCSEVAAELRKLADALASTPDAEIVRASIYFSCVYQTDPKTPFLALAKVLPRPLDKKHTDSEYRLVYNSPALSIDAYTKRAAVCELVTPAKPAVYKCEESFLSPDEEAQLEGAA